MRPRTALAPIARRLAGVTVVIAGLGAGLGAGVARAQSGPESSVEYQGDFDPEQFQASTDPEPIGLVDGARTQPRGTLAVGVLFNLGGPPLDIEVSDRGCDPAANPECTTVRGDLLNSRLRADLGVLYGLGRFDVRLTVPFVLEQSSDFAPAAGAAPLRSYGVGNPRLGVRAQLVRRGAIALAADVAAQLPTGGRNFIGDDALVVDGRALFDVHAGRLWAGVGAGYRYRGGPSAHLANLYLDDEVLWSAAVQYWLRERTLAVGAAAYGKLGVRDAPASLMDAPAVVQELGAEERPAEVLASLRYLVSERLALELGAGTALSAGYGAPPFRVLAGVRWVHRPGERAPLVTDGDHDGIDDRDDGCPRVAEDRDGFEDLDGCREADNDGDRVDDADDGCPMVAEDADGFEDGDGCPELDNDRDGLTDADDACRDEAEDADGLLDGDGCPEADADGDGLVDTDDRCPLEAEIYNGVDDEDGCADDGGPAVTIGPTQLLVPERIYFDLDRARIKRRSHAVLDAIAAILRAHGGLRIRIEGHTDDQGERDWNRTLSQLRAERVRAYLIGKGVAAERLEAEGFGHDRPLVEGTSELARERNRRVEFVLVDEQGGETRSGEALPAPSPTFEPEAAPAPGPDGDEDGDEDGDLDE